MRYITSAYYDAGIRDINEDSLLVEEIYIRNRCLVLGAVADGVGGLSEGQIASGYTIESIMRVLYMDIKSMVLKGRGLGCLRRIMLKCLYDIYEALKRYADIKNQRMGSTLSMLLIIGRRYLLIHIGDSAVFKCRGHRMKQITPIHQNDDGSLNRCIGSMTFQKPYVKTGWIFKGTGFLLCTDGFYKRLDKASGLFNPKELIEDYMIEKRLSECGKLVAKKGEQDNKAAVYIRAI